MSVIAYIELSVSRQNVNEPITLHTVAFCREYLIVPSINNKNDDHVPCRPTFAGEKIINCTRQLSPINTRFSAIHKINVLHVLTTFLFHSD